MKIWNCIRDGYETVSFEELKELNRQLLELGDVETVLYKEETELRLLIESKNPDAVVFPADEKTEILAPRLAAALDTGLSQNCVGIRVENERLVWSRWAYNNSLIAEITCNSNPQLGTILMPGRAGILDGKEISIDKAEVVVCVGRGCGTDKGPELCKELAEVLEGAVGATRAVTDAGILPISRQIGQTGKYIRPRIYIGVGVAGAIQHMAGMRHSDVIIAINRDARAPIFKYADYGIVGDLFEIVPEMIKTLKSIM